jgi:hypothetical protein
MTTKTIIIHVRFAPDGTVTEIGERPASLTAQQWHDRLAEKAGIAFEALSGGRGMFRLSPDQVESFKSVALQ